MKILVTRDAVMKIIIEEEGPNQFKVLYAKICKDYAQLKVLKVLTVIK